MKSFCFQILLLMVTALLALIPNRTIAADEMTDALQKALFEEEANHNLESAISSYQRVVTQFGQQQKLAATAIYRLGECYRKLGKTNEAVAQYQRLLRDFSQETNLINLSRQNLAGLGKTPRTEIPMTAGYAVLPTDEEEQIRRLDILIKNSPDLINASIGESGSPLHKAAGLGQLAVVQFLLSRGANINVLHTTTGQTPLHWAATAGHKAMVELLLKNGADVNSQDQQLQTPLHLATARSFKAIVDILLAAKADPNLRTKSGATSLHVAAGAGSVELAQALVEHGAETDAVDTKGGTPLRWVIQKNKHAESGLPGPAQARKMAAFLIEKGASLNRVDNQQLYLIAPLIGNEDLPMLQLLLEKGADPNDTGGQPNLAPLQLAMKRNPPPLAIIKLLLQYKADPNVPFLDSQEYALHYAARTDQPEVVKMLLEAGAKVEQLSIPQNRSTGWTPLQLAIFNRQTNTAELLLRAGADVNAEEENYGSLLHWAAQEQNVPLVTFLLKEKANPNAINSLRRTPLHIAAIRQNREIVELLLKNGADPNALDKEAKNPLGLLLLPASTGQPGFAGGRVALPPPALGNPFPARPVRSLPAAGTTKDPSEEIADLLRGHGAEELPARERSIWVSRPLTKPAKDFPLSHQWKAIFNHGKHELNQFTLFETVAALYGDKTGWQFPDWAKITINRYQKDGASAVSVSFTQDLQQAFATRDCTKDVQLNWGDVVIVPEADHKLTEAWTTLPVEVAAVLHQCLKREVSIIIKNERQRLTFSPLWPAQETPGADRRVNDFKLSTLLTVSGLLRASSDRSRIYVFRKDPASGQLSAIGGVWNLTGLGNAAENELWIRDGDVILVPETDAPPITKEYLDQTLSSVK